MSTPSEQAEIIKEMQAELNEGRLLFNDISRDIKDHTSILNRIEAQTIKTNGRVLKLEEKDVQTRIENARKDAIAKHSYTLMKLIRDLGLGAGFVGAALRIFG